MEPVYTLVRRSARLYQRISAFVILALASVGLLYFLLYFTINSGFANQIFDATFNQKIKGKITWSRLSWGPLPWKIKVLDPAILDASGNPVVKAKSLTVEELDLFGLLEGHIRINGVDIDSPVIRIADRIDPNQKTPEGDAVTIMNIAEAFEPVDQVAESASSGDTNIEINGIRMSNGTFTMDLDRVAIVAEGVNVQETDFRLYSARSGNVMAFQTGTFDFDDGEIRVSKPLAITRPLDTEPSDYFSWPLKDLVSEKIHWHGDQFRIDGTTFLMRGDSVDMPRIQMSLDRPGLPHIEAQMSFSTDAIQSHLENFGIDGIQGPMSVKLDGSGELDAFDGTVALTGQTLNVFGVNINDLALELEHSSEGRARLKYFSAGLKTGRISGHAEVDLKDGFLRANIFPQSTHLKALNIDIPTSVKTLERSLLSGNIRLVASDLFGEIPEYRVQSQLRIRNEDPHPFGLGRQLSLDVDATYSDDTVSVEYFKISDGRTKAILDGTFDRDTYLMTLKGKASTKDLRPITRAFGQDIGGALQLSLNADGSVFLPKLRARVDAQNIQQGDFPKMDASGRLTFQGGRLDLDRWNIESEKGNVSLKGWMHLKKKGIPWDLRVNARKFEIGALPLGLPVSGRAGLDIRLKGSVKKPLVSGRGRIGRPCYETPYGKRPLCFRRLDIAGEWLGDRFSLEQLRVRDNRRTLLDVSGSGRVKKQRFDGRLKVDRLPTSLVNFFVPKPLPIRGDISADLTLEGTLTAPVGRGEITIHGGGYDVYDIGDSTFEVEAKDGGVRLDGSLFDRIKIRAHIPLGDDKKPATGQLEFDGLSVEEHLPQLKSKPLKTFLSGRVDIQALPFQAKLLKLDANLTQMQASYDLDDGIGYTLELRHPAQFTWTGGPISLDRADVRIKRREAGRDVPSEEKDSYLVFSGTSDLKGELDLITHGQLALELVRPYLNSLFTRSDGLLKLEGTLKGPIAHLRPNLDLTMESAELSPRARLLGARLTLNEPVQLTMSPVEPKSTEDIPKTGSFQLRLADRIGMDGRQIPMRISRDDTLLTSDELFMEFLGYKPERIRVSASGSELELNVPRVMKGTFNAPRMTFEMWEHRRENRRPERRMKISGEIDVIEGEYVADLTSSSDINQDVRNRLSGRARRHSVSIFERIPSLKRLMLDLKVTGNGGFHVRNQVLTLTNDLEIKLNLQEIKGFLISKSGDTESEGLKIKGSIEVLPDSKITYARREFDVTSGRVTLGGNNFFQAEIEATRTFALRTDGESSTVSSSFDTGASDVRLEEVALSAGLTINLRGQEPKLRFDLSSNSGASKLDVAWLVLTGSYPDNLSGSASAQPAAEVVLAPLLSLVERPLEDTFNVDLTLTPVSSGTLYIDANKFLSRRLRLYSRVFVGDEDDGNPQQFGLQYQINNVAFGELSSAQSGSSVSTTGKLKLRLSLK